MKNKIKWFCFIALVAIIGFSFISCDKNKGGISANFKFRDAAPPANVSGTGRSAMGGTTVNTSSFTRITNLYNGDDFNNGQLGGAARLVKAYTPEAFRAHGTGLIGFFDNPGEPHLYNFAAESFNELVDFKAGATIECNPFYPEDIVKGVLVQYKYDNAVTTFTLDMPLTENHPWKTQPESYGANFDGNKVSVKTQYLFVIPADGTPYAVTNFLFTGTEYAYLDALPDLFNEFRGYIIPWAGITAEGMDNITFNVNWKLDGIIEQYCTAATKCTSGNNCGQCKFVIANNYWLDRFSFTVN